MTPEGWKKEKLKYVIVGGIKNGYSPVRTDEETLYKVLSLGALTDAGLKAEEFKYVEFSEKVKNSLLNVGDFLVSRSNTPDKVGRSVMYRGELENCSYPDLMMRFRADNTCVFPLYLELFLQSNIARQYFKANAAGSSKSMVKINKNSLENLSIPLPPMEEQTKIAHIIATWNKAILTTQQLIQNCIQGKTALMQALMNGSIRIKGDYPSWQDKKIGEVAELQRGYDLPKAQRISGKVPVVSSSGVTGLHNNHKVTPPGVVTGRYGSIGEVFYIEENFWPLNTSLWVKDFHGNHPKFIYYLLKGIDFKKYSDKTGVPGINRNDIHAIQTKIPEIEEQEKIATLLTKTDKEIEFLQQKVNYLKKEQQALVQQLFTGKRRVSVT